MNNQFRVATFNLLNLVSPNVHYYGKKHYSKQTFNKKKQWICQQLKHMNADIVGFQEVFHEEALQEVVDASGLYPHAQLATANANGSQPVVGLLSRFPIKNVEVIVPFPEVLDIEGMEIPIREFRRPVLKADVEVRPGLELCCYVVHLKSKRPIYPDGKEVERDDPVERGKGQARALILRAAEAAALRSLLMHTLQKRSKPVIVMGDVNDSGMAVTSRIISGEPPFRKMAREQKKKIWDVLLYHVKDVQARRSYHDFYYTHIHNGHYESLDHIMVSQELVQENPNHIGRVGQVQVLNDHLVDETFSRKKVNSWQSDHGQVVATIELRDPK
ncbi:MAG: endonuclease/exonuclease/phosphatase family protein [Bacteroidetes bacterium]|nr:MAG: endonuclease/exonuclease/phosphatase family protein [Bacteroidota bacterium]